MHATATVQQAVGRNLRSTCKVKESQLTKLARLVYGSLPTPYACAMLSRLNYGLETVLKETKAPDPNAYDNCVAFRHDYMCYNFLRKTELEIVPESTRREAAIASFKRCEEVNRLTNRKFIYPERAFKSDVLLGLNLAQRKMRSILGEFDYGEWFSNCQWGPGATSTIKRRLANRGQKHLEAKFSVTPSCLPAAQALFHYNWQWARDKIGNDVSGPCSLMPSEFKLVRADVFDTVFKQWNVDRTIQKQPTLNGYLQRGIGISLRRRLRREGIDLRDQSANQRAASKLSNATLDIEDASNSQASGLIRYLLDLCPSWLHWLGATRTECTDLDGEVIPLQMFSAMGNGFTFELETLVFYCLSYGAMKQAKIDGEILVYGDDIIVPVEAVQCVTTMLTECGFRLNSAKSFWTGPFRESCGKHYWCGEDVTPVFQKEVPASDLGWIRCANRLYRFALRSGCGIWLDVRYRRAHAFCVESADSAFVNNRRRKAVRHLRRQGRKSNDTMEYRIPRLFWSDPSDTGLLDSSPPAIVKEGGVNKVWRYIPRFENDEVDHRAYLNETYRSSQKRGLPDRWDFELPSSFTGEIPYEEVERGGNLTLSVIQDGLGAGTWFPEWS